MLYPVEGTEWWDEMQNTRRYLRMNFFMNYVEHYNYVTSRQESFG